MRSLVEEEDKTLTFYEFPATMRQRTDQIDVLYFGGQLPDDCVGHHAGYPLAQNLLVSRLRSQHEGQINSQPERVGQEGMVFVRFAGAPPLCSGLFPALLCLLRQFLLEI